MASDRRPSMNSLRSAISRTSMGSHRPRTPPLGERRPPSPLTQPAPGVPTLSPPNIAKGNFPPPMTPQRKPVQRQKSPLSAEAFSSPASIMPGSFPADTPSSAQPHEDSPASGSRSSKRLSSMTKFLPFKALRRSYDAPPSQPSDFPDQYRPKTPGGESTMSSSKPSLRKRVSGTFWRRKSSLGMQFTPGEGEPDEQGRINYDGEDQPATEAGPSPTSPRTNGFGNHDTIQENPRPTTPTLGDNSPITMKKRKSGTFWRRTSSLTLTQTMNAERQGWNRKTSGGAEYPIGNGNGHPISRLSEDLQGRNLDRPPQGSKFERLAGPVEHIEGNKAGGAVGGNGEGLGGMIKRKTSSLGGQNPVRRVSERKPLPLPPRTPSPPPQLPPFVGAGAGLGLEEWGLEGF